jgi:hypothetical protein
MIIAFEMNRECMVSRVIDEEFAWGTFTFLRGRGVEKTFVHVLAMKQVMNVSPSSFVFAQVDLVRHTAGFPVMSNVLLEDSWLHHRDVNFPLPEPLGTLGNEIHAR